MHTGDTEFRRGIVHRDVFIEPLDALDMESAYSA